jgi:predicted ATP-grasp superfamily ATP-dependent carboligase
MRIFLSQARAFGRTGKLVHAIPGNIGEPALKSKYVHEIHPVTAYHKSPLQWRKDVAEILDQYNFDLIVPCIEPDLIAMNENRDIFKGRKLAIPSADHWNLFFDKKVTHEVCSDLNINVCKFSQLSDSDTQESLIAKFGLPLVVKPQRSYWRDQLDIKEKVHIIENKAELKTCLKEIGNQSRFLAEAYFAGVGVGVSVLANQGIITQAFQHRRLREGRGGSSSYRISEALDPRLLDACTKLMKHAGFTGVCMFEFRVSRESNDWVLLETNSRFWGSMPLPISLGVDFPNQLLAVFSNREPVSNVQYEIGVRSRNYILDGFNLAKAELNMSTFVPWLGQIADYLMHFPRLIFGVEKNDSFVRDDMMPGVWELIQLPWKMMTKTIASLKKYSKRANSENRSNNKANSPTN